MSNFITLPKTGTGDFYLAIDKIEIILPQSANVCTVIIAGVPYLIELSAQSVISKILAAR